MTTNKHMSRWIWLYIGVILLSFAIRMSLADHSLPYVDHLDEPNFYMLANDWRGKLDATWRNDWLAGYPPGYIWLYSGTLELIDLISEPNIHTDMGMYVGFMRAVSILIDTITLSLIMVAARWLSNHRGALLAGGIWAVSSAVLTNAILALPDSPTVLFCALTTVMSIRAFKEDSIRYGLLATTAALMGIVFKYPVFPLLILPGLYFLLLLWRKRLQALVPSAVALVMVVGTAVGLLFVYGAGTLSNAEGTSFRNNFVQNMLDLTRWGYVFNAFFGTLGLPLVIFTLAAVLFLLSRRRLKYPMTLAFVLFTGFILMALVVGYLAYDPPRVYPIRYTWPAMPLIVTGFATLIAQATRRKGPEPLFLFAALVSVLWLAPTTLQTIMERSKDYNYTVAQRWFEENAPDGSNLWIESYENYRSLGRYDAGYSGFKTFPATYAQEARDWNGDPRAYDYIYLRDDDLKTWSLAEAWPPLDELTLIKTIGGDEIYGQPLYIYLPYALPNAQQTAFTTGDSMVMLRGIDITHTESQLQIESYWQAPRNRPEKDYSYFVHVTTPDDPSNIVAQRDDQLGNRPTSTWTDPNELLRGELGPVDLPDLSPGEYVVRIGVYYWEDGVPFTLEDGSSALDVMQFTVE